MPEVSKIRPITCTSHSTKMVEECLRIGLSSWISTARLSLLAHQHAYIPNRSTVTARITARNYALAAARHADSCVLFVDFSDAFGSVRRDQLLEIVRRHGFWQEDEIALWRWLWSAQQIRCGRARGLPSLGIPQGSKIGGEMWNLVLAELVSHIPATTASVVAYADDVAIVCGVAQLASVFAALQAAATRLGLRVNVKPDGSKTAVMPVSPDLDKLPAIQSALAQVCAPLALPVVTKYHYLGSAIGPDLSATQAIDLVKGYCTQMVNQAKTALSTLTLSSRASAWRTFFLPVLMPTALGA